MSGDIALWPPTFADWRERRRSVRDFVVSFGAFLVAAVVFVPLLMLVQAFVHTPDGPAVTVGYFLVCLVVQAVLRRGRAGTTERAVAALRVPRTDAGPSGALDGPLDGELRGPLDRTCSRALVVSAVAASGGTFFLAAAARGGDVLTTFVPGGALVLSFVLLAARHVWQGSVDVRWVSGTLVPGGRAVFYVGAADGEPRFADPECILRCIEPAPGRVPATVRTFLPESRTRTTGPGGDVVEITILLPEDAPASALDLRPPLFWELVVRGRTEWGRVTESFLVPVRFAGGQS